MFGRKRKRAKKKTERRGKKGVQQLCLANSRASFPYVEAYKTLRTRLDFLAGQSQCKTILITSPMPGDGKTTVAVNLAYALGDAGKKVILVDGDMRKGAIASYAKVNPNVLGLSDILTGKQALTDSIIYHEGLKTDILTAGVLPKNPAELAGSPRMKYVLCRLRECYDYVILDTPAVSLVTDAAVLSQMTDGVILVARAGATARQELNLCKKSLEDMNVHILGGILNDYHVDKRLRKNKNYSLL